MSLAREQIVARHATELPRSNGGIGPLGVLKGELAKKRNHLPIRQLLDRAAPVIQQIKPIFMMSPLSIAQFLKQGSVSFDLLVVDEASQIEPIDALGAVARCDALQASLFGPVHRAVPCRMHLGGSDHLVGGVWRGNSTISFVSLFVPSGAFRTATRPESYRGICAV